LLSGRLSVRDLSYGVGLLFIADGIATPPRSPF
jgi:hypothetical protein